MVDEPVDHRGGDHIIAERSPSTPGLSTKNSRTILE